MVTSQRQAIVVGVGAERGLGAGLANRFAREGHHVVVAGRSPDKLVQVVRGIAAHGGSAEAVVADATKESDIGTLFDHVARNGYGALDLVVFNAGNNIRHDVRTLPADLFEDAWRTSALGGFLVGREAARRLEQQERGTIIFTGATASLRGKPPFTAFAAAKAALRSVAQSLAREFGPRGLHVAHVIIDGGIDGDKLAQAAPQRKAERGEDGLLNIDAIADAYWHLYRQHRSAWTHELDLRPFKEPF